MRLIDERADYWKSQERKYCDFCKCWIADNKPSVEFHEKGRRHQENVKKRLKNITKSSAKAHRESENADRTLKQMEAAAMAAYRRDVESNSVSDLTSIAIKEKLKKENLSLNDGESKKIWHEAKSKEGNIYYWNILTNVSVWEPPKEGYLSMEEQQEEKYLEDQDKRGSRQKKKGKKVAEVFDRLKRV
ncbi:hypothetical protein JTB14_023680 [Gonioctena quinquepunctata]|nr:hypothetical protein JTB14_023680 [Gonioctena quinquepunctata]